jgi:GNAT superfamily N-acetyltransferase
MNIKDNPNDERWVNWGSEIINHFKAGSHGKKHFIIIYNGRPIGEGTLLLTPNHIQGRTDLANGTTIANISALRITKQHEGKGHMSKLVKVIEQYAAKNGCTQLTIGVEPKDTRNIAIYLHWGYNTFVKYDVEEDGGLALYYSKAL